VLFVGAHAAAWLLIKGIAGFEGTALAPYFLPASRVIAFLTPSEVKERFHDGYAAIEHWWTQH